MQSNLRMQSRVILRESESEYSWYIINELFGHPLFGFYIIEYEAFDPSLVEGTLMQSPLKFIGPFESADDALEQIELVARDIRGDSKLG